jgi:cell division protein FtsW (lipid II flippase)
MKINEKTLKKTDCPNTETNKKLTGKDKSLMKIYSIITIVLFFIFALLQLNDPDPYLWFPIYLVVCILAGIRWKYEIKKSVLIIFTASYLVLAVYFWLQIPYWGMEVEEVRETLGLLLAALFVLGLGFQKKQVI